MQILGWEAGEKVSLIAHGAEVAFGSVEHCEVAAVVVRGVDGVVIEGAHGSAGSLGDAGAGIDSVRAWRKTPLTGCVADTHFRLLSVFVKSHNQEAKLFCHPCRRTCSRCWW